MTTVKAYPEIYFLGTAAGGVGAIALSWPTGCVIVENDIILVAAESSNQTISAPTVTGLTFTEVTAQVGYGTAATAASLRLGLFWARVGSGWTQANLAVADSGDHTLARAIVIRGCRTTGDPWNAVSAITVDSTSDTSGSCPDITTTADRCLVLTIAARGNDSSATTQFSAWTNANLKNLVEFGEAGTTGGTGGGIGIAAGWKATAGAVGATTYTQAAASYHVSVTIAFDGAVDTSIDHEWFTSTFTLTRFEYGRVPSSNFRDPVTGDLCWIVSNSAQSSVILYTSQDNGLTHAIVSGASFSGYAPSATCIDSAGNVHQLHTDGGAPQYRKITLTRSGTPAHITGWSAGSAIALPSTGATEWYAADICAMQNGNGTEVLIITATSGNSGNTYYASICTSSLTPTATSSFTNLTGTASSWTNGTSRTQSASLVFAPYCFSACARPYGSSGHFAVVIGPTGQNDKDDYGCSVWLEKFEATGANWAAGASTEISGDSYESFPGVGCTTNGAAYFPHCYATTATTITGSLRVARVASDGTVTSDCCAALAFGNRTHEPALAMTVTSGGQVILFEGPIDYAATTAETVPMLHSCESIGGAWYTRRLAAPIADGRSWAFGGHYAGPSGWTDGLILTSSHITTFLARFASARMVVSAGISVTAEAGSASGSGQAASLLAYRVTAADAGSASAAGFDAGIFYQRLLSADAGAATGAGQDATITLGAVSSIVVTAEPGAATGTGSTATPLANRIAGADAGAATGLGTDAGALAGRRIDAEAGSATGDGATAGIAISTVTVALPGSAAGEGQSVNVYAFRSLPADTGTATGAGQDAGVLGNRVTTADEGSAAGVGDTASILISTVTQAAAGAATGAGISASTFANRVIGAASGVATGAGTDATITVGSLAHIIVTAEAGSASAGAQDAVVLALRKLLADTGAATGTGQDSGVLVSRRLDAEAGAATGEGQDAAITLGALSGIVVTTETGEAFGDADDADIVVTRMIAADTGTATGEALDAGAHDNASIVADAGAASGAGQDVGILRHFWIYAAPGSAVGAGQIAQIIASNIPVVGEWQVTASVFERVSITSTFAERTDIRHSMIERVSISGALL